MPKIIFNKAVKYDGTSYPAGKQVPIADKDLSEALKAGGYLVKTASVGVNAAGEVKATADTTAEAGSEDNGKGKGKGKGK